MQTTISPSKAVPLPESKKKRLMQAEIDMELANAVIAEIKKNKPLKIREVMEWGFAQWLTIKNPAAAKRVIKPNQ